MKVGAQCEAGECPEWPRDASSDGQLSGGQGPTPPEVFVIYERACKDFKIEPAEYTGYLRGPENALQGGQIRSSYFRTSIKRDRS